jgi:5'-nucleotidase
LNISTGYIRTTLLYQSLLPLFFRADELGGSKNLKIVLTNDDGIDAAGLQILQQCVQNNGLVVIVAPAQPQSGIAHRVTTRSAIRVEQLATNKFSVDGTPADCVRLALKKIAPDAHWLIAGINPGANLGSDVYNSGTVAAAREAAILGYRSIAISQYIAKDQEVDWHITGHHAEPVLKMLMDRDLARSHFWNVNLPHPLVKEAEIAFKYCPLDTHPHKYDFIRNENEYSYSGSIHERPRDPGTDVAVCFDEKKIAITQIAVGTDKLNISR